MPNPNPMQPQPATTSKQDKTAVTGDLERLEQIRDLNDQKAQAAETYGKSAGKKQPKTGQ